MKQYANCKLSDVSTTVAFPCHHELLQHSKTIKPLNISFISFLGVFKKSKPMLFYHSSKKVIGAAVMYFGVHNLKMSQFDMILNGLNMHVIVKIATELKSSNDM